MEFLQYDINSNLKEQERNNNFDILIVSNLGDVVYCNNEEIISDVNSIQYIKKGKSYL